MVGRRNSVLLGLAVGLGALVVAGLAFLFREREAGLETVPIGQTARAGSAPAPSQPTSIDPEGGERLSPIPDPRLSVVAVSTDGLPVLGARIVATGPRGVREALGTARWENPELGDWVIEITCEGYLPAREELALIDGAQVDLVVTLYDSVDVHGRVVDTVGSPVPRIAVRFELDREGRSRREGRTPTVATDADGRFVAQLEEAGAYRLAVGTVNQTLLEMPTALALEPGRHDVEIVVPGTGSVRILLDDPPKAVLEAERVVHARLYVGRQGASTPTAEPRRTSVERKRPPSALPDPSTSTGARPRDTSDLKGTHRLTTGRKSDDPSKPPRDKARQPPAGGIPPLGKEWVHKASKPLEADGSALFRGLDDDREYHLVLEHRRVRYQSTRSFQLQPGRSTSLRTSLPPAPVGSDGKRLGGSIQPLELLVDYHAPQVESPAVGFHWKE